MQPPSDSASRPDAPTRIHGAIRLLTFRGIRVFLHWSWLLVAIWQIDRAKDYYEHPIWAVAEYVTLFVIVLLHEFGHAFATRQTGGRADTILLWPFGGIAFVQAPNRPGAHLWGIAAGPLVNVALVPVLWLLTRTITLQTPWEFAQYLITIFQINLMLLIFNLLPIYPLDGGQVLRTLLWFKLGPLRSLEVAAIVGLIGGAALAIWAGWYLRSLWTPLLVGLLMFSSWRALQSCREIRRREAEAHPV